MYQTSVARDSQISTDDRLSSEQIRHHKETFTEFVQQKYILINNSTSTILLGQTIIDHLNNPTAKINSRYVDSV